MLSKFNYHVSEYGSNRDARELLSIETIRLKQKRSKISGSLEMSGFMCARLTDQDKSEVFARTQKKLNDFLKTIKCYLHLIPL